MIRATMTAGRPAAYLFDDQGRGVIALYVDDGRVWGSVTAWVAGIPHGNKSGCLHDSAAEDLASEIFSFAPLGVVTP